MTPAFLVGVVGVVLNERGEILLLEHVFHRAYPWGLPGGWMDRGESSDQTLRRELREEVELEIEIGELLAIEPDDDSHAARWASRAVSAMRFCLPVGFRRMTCPSPSRPFTTLSSRVG